MKSFSELSLSALLKSNLKKHGFTEPTPVQALAIEPALAGRDLVATAQTGTGKTLAFVLPLIQLLGKEPHRAGIRAMILSPTRELAIQIAEAFGQMAAGSGIRAAVVVGGLGEGPQLQAIRKGAQVIVATPGRLYDFLTRELVNLAGVRILVLDEADRMLDMGFLPPSNGLWRPHRRIARRCFSRPPSNPRSNTWWRRKSATPCASRWVPPPSPSSKWTCTFMKWSRIANWRCWRPCCGKRLVRSWSSPAPSTAPTASRSAWPRAARRPPPFTATAPRTSATRHCAASRTDTTASWWPPTWRRAGFTWTASPTW